jgi:hypothetical protein
MQDIIPRAANHSGPARRIMRDLCWAAVGKPCTVSGPPGDHLIRLANAVRLGLLSRDQLAEVVVGLAVIADHVVILKRAA